MPLSNSNQKRAKLKNSNPPRIAKYTPHHIFSGSFPHPTMPSATELPSLADIWDLYSIVNYELSNPGGDIVHSL